jgi:hypothetical protein
MDNRRRRFTYAHVASTLALVIALGGSAFAAAKITSADIVNKTIKPVDISTKAKQALLPQALLAFRNDAGTFTGNGNTTLGTLGLLNGSWAVTAKVWLRNDGGSSSDVVCSLSTDNDSDIVWSRLGASGGTSTVAFNLLTEGKDRAELVCNANGGTIHAFDMKITGVKVGKTTKFDIGGP